MVLVVRQPSFFPLLRSSCTSELVPLYNVESAELRKLLFKSNILHITLYFLRN